VKWFTDGAEFNTGHELLIWLWSSTMAQTNYSTKYPFAAIPMRWLPTKELRSKANRAVVQAWDSTLTFNPLPMSSCNLPYFIQMWLEKKQPNVRGSFRYVPLCLNAFP